MQHLCDTCHGVYRNKLSLNAHQNKTGHRQNTIVTLEDSSNLTTEIAILHDSFIANNAEITRLKDLLENKESDIAILNNEVVQLSSLEHEKDIVRNTLKKLTEEQYDLIGKQLGYTEEPKPQPVTAPVADVKPETPGEKWWREFQEGFKK